MNFLSLIEILKKLKTRWTLFNLCPFDLKLPFVLPLIKNTTGEPVFTLIDYKTLDVCLKNMNIQLINVLTFVRINPGKIVMMVWVVPTPTQLLKNYTILQSISLTLVNQVQVVKEENFVLFIMIKKNRRKLEGKLSYFMKNSILRTKNKNLSMKKNWRMNQHQIYLRMRTIMKFWMKILSKVKIWLKLKGKS